METEQSKVPDIIDQAAERLAEILLDAITERDEARRKRERKPAKSAKL